MANGRPPDDGSSRSSRSARAKGANAGGLESLGQQVPGGARSGEVANQSGLQALGARIDQSSGRGRKTKRSGKPRKTAGQRLLRVAIVLVAFIVVIAAGGFALVQYELGNIKRAPCPACAAVADGAPYNVLVVGSDTRSGETAAQAQQFGNSSNAGGQRSDTIKIIHVDPKAGTASVLSLPRDTFVHLSGVPTSSGVSNPNKLNAAFSVGPNDPDPSGTGANGLVQTIQNTFGIPISHWIVVNFFGLMDAVNALGGVSLNVPYPVKDYGDCNANGVYSNCTGLNLQAGTCQTVSGDQALALSRSRHFEWYQNGYWHSDESGDIGRIERQDLMIEAVVNKAKSTYNPVQAVSFINSLTHDVTLDNNLSATALLSLAQKYHAFSGSSLQTYTLPTNGALYAPYGEDVQVVQEPTATQMVTQFLGAAPETPKTPPLDQYGSALSTSGASASAGATGSTGSTGTAGSTATTAAPSGSATTNPSSATAPAAIPPYDPRPC